MVNTNGLQLVVRRGEPGKPAFIFIHGLGMNHLSWTDPAEAKMMGGMLSLKSLLKEFDNTQTLFHDVQQLGCSAITWSQRRPVGPVAEAVSELLAVIEAARDIPSSSLILVGHSRGGLIARAALEDLSKHRRGRPITGMLTICSPHAGSSLPHWAAVLSPAAQVFKNALPASGRSEFLQGLKRSLGFIASSGAVELLPESEFIRSLPDQAPEGVTCYSVGGTNPSILNSSWLVFPEALIRMLPANTVPAELIMGKGDALVTAKSAVLPYAGEHMDFHCNHLTILVDPNVKKTLINLLKQNLGA